MRLMIIEAIETGMLQVPFYPDNPYLFYPFWGCFLMAIIIQYLLFKKCKHAGRWGFIILSLFGIFCCEIAYQIITGWDLILWMILWFLCLTFLIGAALCTLVYILKKKAGEKHVQ